MAILKAIFNTDLKCFVILLPISLLMLSMTSCVTNNRLTLLKSKDKSYPKSIKMYDAQPYRLKDGDVIKILVESTVATNLDLIDQKFKGEQSIYTINIEGDIDIPLIGKIKAAGKTLRELELLIEASVKEYIEFVTVKVFMDKFPIHFLGEFKTNGLKVVEARSQMNLLEAIAISGGLTDYGNPKKVKIIRRNGQTMDIYNVSISGEDVIESQYFAIFPNDLVYVAPMIGRNFKNNIQYVTLITSAITLFLLLLNNRVIR